MRRLIASCAACSVALCASNPNSLAFCQQDPAMPAPQTPHSETCPFPGSRPTARSSRRRHEDEGRRLQRFKAVGPLAKDTIPRSRRGVISNRGATQSPRDVQSFHRRHQRSRSRRTVRAARQGAARAIPATATRSRPSSKPPRVSPAAPSSAAMSTRNTAATTCTTIRDYIIERGHSTFSDDAGSLIPFGGAELETDPAFPRTGAEHGSTQRSSAVS
jgi:hypothetical protein